MRTARGKQRPLAILCLSMAGGGAELAVARLANGLSARGHSIDLVLWRKTGPILDKVNSDVRVIALGGRRPFLLFRIARYFLTERPRLVLSHQTFLNSLAALALQMTFNKAPLLATEHNAYTRAIATKRSWILGVYRLAPLLYRRCDIVAAVSSGVAQDAHKALKVPSAKLRVVYNPAVSPMVHEQAATASAPHPWLADAQVPVFISVNRLVPQKNPQLLLRAFAQVRRHMPCRLIFLGAGQLETELEGQTQALGIAKDVYFAGFMPNPYAWIVRAHTLVLASDFEGFAIVVAEALALGTRVVSTDCEFGPAEILNDGEYGRLVAVGDEDALAAAMKAALETHETGSQADLRKSRGGVYNEIAYLDRYEAIMKMLLEGAATSRS